MALITVTIPTCEHGPVTVTGDQVTENFAITPALTVHDDGTLGLSAYGKCLVHLPTGRAITHDAMISMRRYATVLEGLPIDWATLTAPTAEQTALINEAYRGLWNDSSDDLPWPKWARDKSTPALSLIVHELDDQLANSEHRRQMRVALEKQITEHDPELGRTVSGHLIAAGAVETVRAYGLVYLLGVLRRIDPAAADRAAEHLVNTWEHGEDLGEWLYQWRQEIAEQIPMQLPGGFPDLPAPAAV
ncbi:hypothetical protein [Nocardia sp. NPDC003726]